MGGLRSAFNGFNKWSNDIVRGLKRDPARALGPDPWSTKASNWLGITHGDKPLVGQLGGPTGEQREGMDPTAQGMFKAGDALAATLGARGIGKAAGAVVPGAVAGTNGAADTPATAGDPGMTKKITDMLGSGMTGADILKALSVGVDGALEFSNNQAAIAERKRQFDRTTGNAEAATAVDTQDRLNRAPMADQAQHLLRARMGAPPVAFAPRDATRGPMTAQSMAAPATGGPATQMAAGQTAANAYRPGVGGVDTSTLEMLKKRMLQSSGMRP